MINPAIISKKIDSAVDVLGLISTSIQQAVDIDLRAHHEENYTETHNAFGLLKGDFINTRIIGNFASTSIRTQKFSRQGWQGVLIIDDDNKLVFTITSKGRLNTVRTERKENPHYMQTLCFVLNHEVEAANRQLNILDAFPEAEGFNQDYLYEDFQKICGGVLPLDDNYLYCVIAHDCTGLTVQTIDLIVMDDEMNVAYSSDLNVFLTAEYAQSDYNDASTGQASEPESSATEKLVTLKKAGRRKAI